MELDELDELSDEVALERARRGLLVVDASLATALTAAAVAAPRPVLSVGISVWLCATVLMLPGPAAANARAALTADPTLLTRLAEHGATGARLVRSRVGAHAAGYVAAALAAVAAARVDHRAAAAAVCVYASARWVQLVVGHTRARVAARLLASVGEQDQVVAWRASRARRAANAAEFLGSQLPARHRR